MPALLIISAIVVYELVVRFLPTQKNWSLIDLFKRSFDQLIPNYKSDDFPFGKHQQ